MASNWILIHFLVFFSFLAWGRKIQILFNDEKSLEYRGANVGENTILIPGVY